jgi:hypothetical protein
MLTVSLLVGGISFVPAVAAQERGAKPSMKLKASSAMAFTPAQIVFTAELRNVTNDDEPFYCPAVEWDWGDGTRSSSSSDCEPYEPGKSQVPLRYVKSHKYDIPGRFQVSVRLRRGTEQLLAATTSVTVRGGISYQEH